MNINKQVKTIKTLQSQYVAIQKSIRQRVKIITKPVEKYVNQRLKEEFPENRFYFLAGFDGGSLTEDWFPQVYLYEVDQLSLAKDGCWYKIHRDSCVAEWFEKRPAPLSAKKLMMVIKKISSEIGIKVLLVKAEQCKTEALVAF